MKKWIALFLFLIPVNASAASFYGQAGAGLGITILSQSEGNADFQATGLSVPIDLVAGAMISPSWALHGNLVLTPVLFGGGSAESGNSEVDLDEFRGVSWFLGGGATWSSPEWYFGGSLGFGAGDGSIETDGAFGVELDLESDVGFGLKLHGGKIVSSAGAAQLGIGGMFHIMSLPPDVGDADNATYFTLGAVFSVVFR